MKSGWKKCKLGDICLINTASYSTSDNYSFINYLDTGSITQNKIEKIQKINLSMEKLPSRAKRKIKYNSIIYSTVRPNQRHYGIIKKHPENFIVSTGFAVIDVDTEKANPDFIYYILIQDEVINSLQAVAEQSVSTYPSIKPSDIEKIDIFLPPLPVQKKIAGILKSLDDKIELNNKINTNLEQQAQALFKNWFVDFEPFGGKMPEGWKEIPLEELCTVVTKGTTPTTLGKKFTDSGINFIKGESILDNHTFDLQKISHIDDETNLMLKRSIIQPNDILFTIAGTLGRFAFIDETLTPANTNQAVGIIRANPEIISPYYLYSFFIGNWHNDYYTKRIQQAVQANLSLGTIKSLPIIIPDSQNLNKYTNLIEPLFRQMKQLENENIKLADLRDTILPKLINGEIEV